jgi:prepilin-type N-terminal cleavage/methylation domain-containing protein
LKKQLREVRGRGAFTLVELLVVIGIIGLLLGILLPALSVARTRARDIKCASNLRQLVMATVMYFNEHKTYPTPPQLSAFGGPVPIASDERLLNEIGPYLKWPTVTPTDTVLTLPPVAVCDLRTNVLGLLDYTYNLGNPYWNTGYSYCAGLGLPQYPNATVLMKDKQSDLKGKRRGVLWADNMLLVGTTAAPLGFAYFHIRGSHQLEQTFLTVPDPVSYRGHHRAWTDGSVEWSSREYTDLDKTHADTAAAYRIDGPTGLRLYCYW